MMPMARSSTFQVSVTKTRPGVIDDAMKVWLILVHGKQEFSNQAITKPPTMTQTDKKRHWTCTLADGSHIEADVSEKSGKVALVITHKKLATQSAAETWRKFWKSFLEKA